MKDKEINRLAEETLSSADEIKSLAPDELLFRRIMTSLNQKENSLIKKNQSIGKYAIAFAALVLINIFSFLSYQKNADNNFSGTGMNYSKGLTEFTTKYFSDQNDYNYGRK